MQLADGDIVSDYTNSITKALLDEELLFVRNFHNDADYVFLTYDLMAGYFIAKYLVDTVTDFKIFFNSEAAIPLFSEDSEQCHPKREDILDRICTLLPIKKGIFVHDLVGNSNQEHTSSERQLFAKSIATTIF